MQRGCLDVWEGATSNGLLGDQSKPAFHLVDPGCISWGVMHVKPRTDSKPLLHFLMFMGTIAVYNVDPAKPLVAMEFPPPDSGRLYEAAEEGDAELVEQLIDEGLNINVKAIHAHDNTPLHNPAENGHAEVVKILVEAGADTNIHNRYGKTPLHWAVGGRTIEFVNLLIQAGTDVNVIDRFGSTPLYEAATYSVDIDIAKALINAEVNVNGEPSSPPTLLPGGTPLSMATSMNNIKMVKLLASHGVDVNVKNDSNNSLLHLTLHAGHGELAALLIESGADVHSRNDTGNPPDTGGGLRWSARRGHATH